MVSLTTSIFTTLRTLPTFNFVQERLKIGFSICIKGCGHREPRKKVASPPSRCPLKILFESNVTNHYVI